MLKTLRVLSKWWTPFSVLKTLRLMASFFKIKTFKSRKAVVEFSLSFKSFKSRLRVFFSGHASLSFDMMIKFPGTIFSLSVPTEFF